MIGMELLQVMADGRIEDEEFAYIRSLQEVASRHIYEGLRDGDRRPRRQEQQGYQNHQQAPQGPQGSQGYRRY